MIGNESEGQQHKPVMLPEAIQAMAVVPGGVYVDATFGRGGHSRALLNVMNHEAQLIVIDQDPEALTCADQLASDDDRVQIIRGKFADGLSILLEQNIGVSSVFMDLGVSSPQLDQATRGFSFQKNGPLDMRMNPNEGQSAAQWLNQASEQDITEVLQAYGEVRHATLYARAIVRRRQECAFESTQDLVDCILAVTPSFDRKHHPATLIFQAIRIHVNSEDKQIIRSVELSSKLLKKSGRLVVLSYHSLEHKWVSEAVKMVNQATSATAIGKIFRKIGHAKRPSRVECESNRRARSAMLRTWEKK
ncbi:MAG: 16S rRNA (cytosine(1402)-N(4))-methyltransferase RsmH [Pseudomonadota bacterium]|nr:16S rRNA (cytosine(1402)-N(4))-methyltransferase RsmH [Pseudomonadota bacterium]